MGPAAAGPVRMMASTGIFCTPRGSCESGADQTRSEAAVSAVKGQPSRDQLMLFSEPAPLREWGRQRLELVRILKRLAELSDGRGDDAATAALKGSFTRLTEGRLTLAILGEFKRGKSTLINALLDADVMPVGVIPTTSTSLWVEYGDDPQLLVEFEDGRLVEVGFEELLEYATETGNPGNQRGVARALIRYPAPILRSGVILIDTPGIGSIHAHNTRAAYEELSQADAAVFVLSIDSPASQAELDFLASAGPQVSRVVFCLNKADLLTPEELAQSVAFVRRALSSARAAEGVTVFPISARLRDEGFQEFRAAMERFLVDDRGRFLIERAVAVAGLYLKREQQAHQLRLAALRLPGEELDARLELLRSRLEEVGRQRIEVEEVLAGDFRRLMADTVDPSIGRFRESGERRLKEVVDVEIARHSGDLRGRLDKRLGEEIQRLVEIWMDQLELELDPAIHTVADRHSSRTNQLIRVARESVGELFGLDLSELSLPTDLESRSERLVLAASQQLALSLVSSAVRGLVPGRWGAKVARRDAVLQGAELVDRHCGRVRHDVAERLKLLGAKWTGEFGAVLVGLERSVTRAMERAVAARADGEPAVAAARALLADSADELKELEAAVRSCA